MRRVCSVCSRTVNDLELTILTWITSNVKLKKKRKARSEIIAGI